MRTPARTALLAAAALIVLLPHAEAGDSPQQTFARAWERQSVVVKRALYTLVYDERGKLGNTYHGRRDGVTVVTPSSGVYFQFDGRQGRDDVVLSQPERMIEAVDAAYLPDSLDLRSYRKLAPIVMHRYDAGTPLVVRSVRFGRDSLRLGLATADATDADDEVTSLTVKWPVPFSKSFTERDVVDGLIRWFVDFKPQS